MELSSSASTGVADFLFRLPNEAMKHAERVRRIKKAIDDDQVREADLDRVMAKLLEELQQSP